MASRQGTNPMAPDGTIGKMSLMPSVGIAPSVKAVMADIRKKHGEKA